MKVSTLMHLIQMTHPRQYEPRSALHVEVKKLHIRRRVEAVGGPTRTGLGSR